MSGRHSGQKKRRVQFIISRKCCLERMWVRGRDLETPFFRKILHPIAKPPVHDIRNHDDVSCTHGLFDFQSLIPKERSAWICKEIAFEIFWDHTKGVLNIFSSSQMQAALLSEARALPYLPYS